MGHAVTEAMFKCLAMKGTRVEGGGPSDWMFGNVALEFEVLQKQKTRRANSSRGGGDI